jgi:hypothetical protein
LRCGPGPARMSADRHLRGVAWSVALKVRRLASRRWRWVPRARPHATPSERPAVACAS